MKTEKRKRSLGYGLASGNVLVAHSTVIFLSILYLLNQQWTSIKRKIWTCVLSVETLILDLIKHNLKSIIKTQKIKVVNIDFKIWTYTNVLVEGPSLNALSKDKKHQSSH